MSNFDDFNDSDDSRVVIRVILMTLMTLESLYESFWCDFLALSQIFVITLYNNDKMYCIHTVRAPFYAAHEYSLSIQTRYEFDGKSKCLNII